MEIKDIVLETLHEIENSVNEKGYKELEIGVNDGEIEFLIALKERIFVLFEGLKQSNITFKIFKKEQIDDIEENDNKEKIDMVFGFLQFQLALIDARIEILEKRAIENEKE